MFRGLVGLTAIEVSLCGPTDASVQSVLTLDALDVAVVQIAVPVLTAGVVPKTASVTGAAAFITFVKLTGCGLSSPATANGWPTANAETAATISTLSLPTSSSFLFVELCRSRPEEHATVGHPANGQTSVTTSSRTPRRSAINDPP